MKNTLVCFQSNIGLEYVYSIRETADGSFMVVIGPSGDEKGQYGKLIHDTEALRKAGQGTPTVDEKSYVDDFGHFYSAYSPVFDSSGKVAGVVASDYRSVYYVNLDEDDGICYRSDPEDKEQTGEGIHFPYLERFTWYAMHSVTENYREGFLNFIEPDNIRKSLADQPIIAYRYLARALSLAEEANQAKTAFLSNMSHEIRTPMNAIIGLNDLALHDENLSAQTREYLEKTGESARHLLGLINDILDMSRIESGKISLRKEQFSFGGMIEQINTMVMSQCNDKGRTYECHIISSMDDCYIGDDMGLIH